MKKIICVISLFFVLGSCGKSTGPKSTDVSEEEGPETDEYVSKLLPMTIGNYWIYEETYTSNDTTYSHDIKSEITAIKNIGNYSWYEMTRTINGYQSINRILYGGK